MISILLVYRDYRDKTTRAKITNSVINEIAAALPRIRFSQINAKYTSTVAANTHSIDNIQEPFAHNVVPHKDIVAATTSSSGLFTPNTAKSGTNKTPVNTSATYEAIVVLFAQIDTLSAFEQNTGPIINLSKAKASTQTTAPLTINSAKIRKKLCFGNG